MNGTREPESADVSTMASRQGLTGRYRSLAGTVQRRTADTVVGLVVSLVLAIGLFLTWDGFREYRAFDGMMGGGGMHAPTHPLWYLLGTLLVAGVLVGVYAVVRDDLIDGNRRGVDDTGAHLAGDTTADSAPNVRAAAEREPEPDTGPSTDSSEDDGTETRPDASRNLLDVLPEDERRVLSPVLESPGLTQIELRDRSEFSKSKVSQTVSDLEKRGLLYREPQGRTYRVYPADDIDEIDR